MRARAGERIGGGEEPGGVADRLHSLAIHLLRRLRREDAAAGLSAPQLSALSVVVYGGPLSLGALAAAEQVRPPTITHLVRQLEGAGLVEREVDASDRRVVRVRATAEGVRVLEAGRARRVATLAERLGEVSEAELTTVRAALEVLERVLGVARRGR